MPTGKGSERLSKQIATVTAGKDLLADFANESRPITKTKTAGGKRWYKAI